MLRYRFLSLIFIVCLTATSVWSQNTIRPNVLLPNGFEVNSYTGNLYQSRTDLKIPGQGLNINITFSYNVSRRSKNWGMGKGWTFNYNMAYTSKNDTVWIERPDGRRDVYKKSGSVFTGPTGVYETLVEYETGKFYVQTKDGLRCYFDNPAHKKLTKMQDANGNLLTLAYTDTLLHTLTNAAGHNLEFTWTSGKLTAITDKTCTLYRKIGYEYDAKGNPTKVTNPIGDFVRYYSDSTSKLIGYTDEAGNNMSMLYNKSGSVKKVTSCATNHTFNYVVQQLKTFVTEQVNGANVITTYAFDNQGRVISKKGNCCGYNVDYAYTADNNISYKSDGNKSQTKYEYDAKGNITKETDPTGNFTSYTYEATHNRVASMTDKNGNTTSYQYNAAGNLTQTNKPLSIVEKATFDARGNKLTATDGDNNTTSYEYDNLGQLTKVTDAEGGVTSYTYDCYGNRLTEKNARNFTTTYEYNGINQLVKVIDALGNATAYGYNKLGLRVYITNALGKTTQYLYDGLGRRIGTISAMGYTSQTEYDEQGNITKETDANGNSTSQTYNNRKQPLSRTDALGHTEWFEYDEAGNKISMSDGDGHVTRMEYNSENRLIKRVAPLGGITLWTYDPLGNLTAEVNANGNATTYQYDQLNRRIKVTDPLGYHIDYTFDGTNNILTERDKNGNLKTTSYDKLGHVKSETNALGGVTRYTYDANGNLISETNPLNFTTSYSYDALDSKLTHSSAMNEVMTYTYDEIGNQKTIVLSNGNVVINTFDDDRRLVQSKDDLGVFRTYTYDKLRNVLTEKDGNNNVTSYSYDRLNCQIEIKDPSGKATTFVFDKQGNLLSKTDRNGNAKRYGYNALHQKITDTDASGNVTNLSYDQLGNLSVVRDAKGNITSYNYDALNRKIRDTYSNGAFHQFTYDGNGNEKTRLDGRGGGANYNYDALNRLVKRSYSSGLEDNFSYDAAGRRINASNSHSAVTFTFDSDNRVLSETSQGKTTGYNYDILSGRRTITYPGGKIITENRNKRHQLVTIKEGSVTHAEFVFDPGNRVVQKKLGSTYSINFGYSATDYLLSLSDNVSNSVSFGHTYDNEGNRLTIADNNRPSNSQKYSYDDIYQITGFFTGRLNGQALTDTISKNFYEYDNLHNRVRSIEDNVEKTYKVNSLNAYTEVVDNGSPVNYAYDGNGNKINEGSDVFSYDDENRVKKVNNGATAEYYYDALGRKIKSVLPGKTTLYYYSANQVVEERNENDFVEKTFVYGTWIDDLVAYTVSNSLFYIVNNPQGSVLAVVNQSGIVVEKYSYDGWGRVSYFTPNYTNLSSSAFGNNILFTGRPLLKGQEAYDLRIRSYNAQIGRFEQKDRLGFVDGYNLYKAYFVPNGTDPFGLKECSSGRVLCQKGPASSNGCGSPEKLFFIVFTPPFFDEQIDWTEYAPSSEFIPEIAFNGACNFHDECWGTCGNDMSYCNREFYNRMISACNQAARTSIYKSALLLPCYSAASYYWSAVSVSEGTYNAAQDKACDCCCPK